MFEVGDRVKIKDHSIYKYQAYIKNGNGCGDVISIRPNSILNIRILWDNGHRDIYPENDIELIEDEVIKIKWYKNNSK